MIKVLVHGAGGAMGRTVRQLLSESFAGCIPGPMVDKEGGEGVCSCFAEVSQPADVILDFSFHAATANAVDYAVDKGIPIVIGTTGHTEEERERIADAAKHIPVFYSGNMSMGIALLCDIAKQAAGMFPDADIEIVEVHHNRKADAPSGTAVMLADAIKERRPEAHTVCGRRGIAKRSPGDIGISSVRMGNIVGIHEVHISTGTETITLKHEAHSRALFAEGALRAAEFICGRSAGLYCMDDFVKGGRP
ncbi:MAG: 4-hydroxy-tetrahydrodipicolinate reductase [Clostridia bacterium]|nr:4-hydroxy-tetrahydrodipicolinate reductase [Clostridia bacterium]